MRDLVRPLAGRLSALIVAFGLAGCAVEPPPTPPPKLDLRPLSFAGLDGWSIDDPRPALIAFRRSCTVLDARVDSDPMGPDPLFGRIGDWRPVCTAAADDDHVGSAATARAFFERFFQPYQVIDNGDPEGLFTGYYEPVLRGSRRFGPPYVVPIHAPPPDLLRVDLGRFNPELAGYSIYGRIADGHFLPYHPRSEIDAGALAGRGLELLWVDDPIDKFFLQIQGSGQVRLDDGSVVRIGYASQNGHPYRAIGRDLIEIGALTRDEVSLQSIRAWLRAHPDDAATIMARNRSYIFFEERPELSAADGPLGSHGVPLEAGRSLAVDARYIPLGAPLWLETTAPSPAGEVPLHRLMVAQDTGGAIRGVVRGDVFWGAGDAAEEIAGRMKSRGRYALLLPKSVTPTS